MDERRNTSSNAGAQAVTACDNCDLLVALPAIAPGHTGRCPRCGAVLLDPKAGTVERTLVAAAAGLLFFGPAVLSPLLTLDAMGLRQSGSIVQGVAAFFNGGYPFVAVVLLLTAVLMPLAKHGLLLFLSVCLRWGRFPQPLEYCLRLYHQFEEWGMDEVYLVGVLVTLIKVYDMADIVYETGFFAFIGLVLCTVTLSFTFDADQYWDRIEAHRKADFP